MDRYSFTRYYSVCFIDDNKSYVCYYYLNRISADDESNSELFNYINEYFWPRIESCSVRLTYTLRDSSRDHKPIERQWSLDVKIEFTKKTHSILSFFF